MKKETYDIFKDYQPKKTELGKHRIDLNYYTDFDIFDTLLRGRAEKALARYIEETGDILFALQDAVRYYEKRDMPSHARLTQDAFKFVENFYDNSLEPMTKEWDKVYAFIKNYDKEINQMP
jgi:hypothetical protein